MCLAVPGQLLKCEESEAEVDLNGNRLRVNTMLVPDARAGDWVLVHAGFAIQVVSAADAAETWSILCDAQKLIAEADECNAHEALNRDSFTEKEV
jgi:hydrogenase expression/formation protein HypC